MNVSRMGKSGQFLLTLSEYDICRMKDIMCHEDLVENIDSCELLLAILNNGFWDKSIRDIIKLLNSEY